MMDLSLARQTMIAILMRPINQRLELRWSISRLSKENLSVGPKMILLPAKEFVRN